MYEDKVIYDNNGRIIYEEHPDGFWERTSYNDITNMKIIETHYSNGITEVEIFGCLQSINSRKGG